GHTGPLGAWRFSPDGERIATASQDGFLKLWDVDTGREILSIPSFHARNLFWVRHGQTLVSTDPVLRLWDASRGYTLTGTEAFKQDLAQVEVVLEEEHGAALSSIESAYRHSKYVSPYASDPDWTRTIMERAAGHPSFHDMDRIKIGLAWCGSGFWPTFTDHFEQLIARGERLNPNLLAGMALCLFKQDRLEEGRNHLNRARAWIQQKNIKEARYLYLMKDAEIAALEAEGKPVLDPELLHWRATTLSGAMKWTEADAAWRNLSERDPDMSPIQETIWRFDGPHTQAIEAPDERTPASWIPTTLQGHQRLTLPVTSNNFCFAMKRIWSQEASEACLIVEPNGRTQLFVNGEVMPTLIEAESPHYLPCPLQSGWNTVFLKTAASSLLCRVSRHPDDLEKARRDGSL
ncbi:MAG: hypothetical protein AAF492_04800, partial [Verrucomicrobiota bacterium]